MWLVGEEGGVAYARTVQDPREEVDCILLEIEVAPGAQGQGLSRLLLQRISEALGKTIYTDGNWTQAGAKALASMPLAPGYTGGVHHEPTSFVKSWTNLQPRYS